MLEKVSSEIWKIENAIPEDLAKKIVKRIDELEISNYFSFDDDPDLFADFNTFWKREMDPVIFDYFYETGSDGISKLYYHDEKERENYRKNLMFEWKNVYVLNYYRENSKNLGDMVHSDFSNFTFSAALLDSEEFEGGELVFPKQRYSVKIKRLDMVLFPGGITHPHYTSPVTSGRRINLIGQSKNFTWSEMRYEK
jgi:hypothetical protein